MSYLPNLILTNVFLVFIWVSFELFFNKIRFFQANRFFLLGGSILAVIIPWLPLQIKMGSQINSIFGIPMILLREISINNPQSNGHSNMALTGQMIPWPGILYISIVVVLITVAFVQFIRLLIWSKTMPRQKWNSHHIVILDKPWSAFSFFHMIYFPAPFEPEKSETQAILEHEKVHAIQLHSFDNLIILIIRILFFYNPAIHLIAGKLRLTHEYIADAAVAGSDKAGYSTTLINHQFHAPRLIQMNSFNNQSFLKRRLIMLLKTKQTRLAGLKYLLSAPLIAVMVLLSGWSSSVLAQVQNKKETVKETTVDQDKKIEAKEPAKFNAPPLFQGGNMEGFSKWIGENLKYPEKAIEANITGKVFVSFEISKTGEIRDVKVVRSANPMLDKEAVRVINSSPAWKPAELDGKPCSVNITIPVNFTLDQKKK